MNKGRFKFILLWFFLIASFIIFSVIIVLEAYGYRLNRQTWKLEPTGTIIVDGLPRQAKLTVNGQEIKEDLPIKLSKLLPGQYDLVLSQENYQTWSKSFRLEGGQAIEAKRLILFLIEPQTVETTRKITLEELQKDFQNQGNSVILKENEIWYQEKLVTRFAQKPLGAILTSERHHLIFQLGNELRVMDIDGTNNLKLVSLPNESAVAFAFYANKLVFASEDKISEAEIR